MADEGNWLTALSDRYATHPVARALVAVAKGIPVLGTGIDVLDAAAIATRDRMLADRLRTLIDELAGGWRDLTPELITEEPFLHAYFGTLRAAMNSQRKEKIQCFAWLLLNGARYRLIYEDRFEEFLAILDSLSLRELHLLFLLEKYGAIGNSRSNDGPEENNAYWMSFRTKALERLNIPDEQVGPMLVRLVRTGLYSLSSTFGTNTQGKGALTPLFAEFRTFINEQAEEGKR